MDKKRSEEQTAEAKAKAEKEKKEAEEKERKKKELKEKNEKMLKLVSTCHKAKSVPCIHSNLRYHSNNHRQLHWTVWKNIKNITRRLSTISPLLNLNYQILSSESNALKQGKLLKEQWPNYRLVIKSFLRRYRKDKNNDLGNYFN